MSLLNAIVTWSGGDASTPSRRSPPTSPFDMREAGPVVVGVSGGRTSAVLLDRVIEASGGLPDDVHPVFTDTGEELPETYQFLERLEAHYGIELVRLRRPPGQPAEAYADYAGDGWPPLCRCSRAHRGRPTMAAGGTSAASASPTDNLCRSPSASGAAWGRTRSMRWRRRRTMRRLCR